MNDVVTVSPQGKTIIYADDTTLLFSGPNYSSLVTVANQTLLALEKWADKNNLTVNASKTKAMFFYAKNKQPPENCTLSYKSQAIQVVSDFRILGVHFSSTLNWNSHVNYVINKLSSVVGALSKLRFVIPTGVKILIYHSLFLSHLNYCQLVWGSTTQTNKQKIFTLQKRALRAIFNIPIDQSIECPLNNLKTFSILTLYDIRLLMTYRKASRSHQQNSFLKLAKLIERNASYPTRQPEKWIVKCPRTNYGSQMMSFLLPSLLNRLCKLNVDIMNSNQEDVISLLTS